jgi:hypothetical protein
MSEQRRPPRRFPAWRVGMDLTDDLATLLDELITAIELRDESDPDSHDWTIDARVRRLERRLVLIRRTEWPRSLLRDAEPTERVMAGIS